VNYVRNTWYVAGWAQDFAIEKPVGMTLLGEPIVIWRGADNVLTALEDRCVHRLAPLSLGRCEGAKLRCMYHGLLYERTGAVCEIPGQEQIPPHARARSYPVREKHSWVWVWMGEAAACDEALIPPAAGCDDPNYGDRTPLLVDIRGLRLRRSATWFFGSGAAKANSPRKSLRRASVRTAPVPR